MTMLGRYLTILTVMGVIIFLAPPVTALADSDGDDKSKHEKAERDDDDREEKGKKKDDNDDGEEKKGKKQKIKELKKKLHNWKQLAKDCWDRNRDDEGVGIVPPHENPPVVPPEPEPPVVETVPPSSSAATSASVSASTIAVDPLSSKTSLGASVTILALLVGSGIMAVRILGRDR